MQRIPFRPWIVISAFALLASVAYCAFGGEGDDGELATLILQPVKKGDLLETVTAQGKLEPREYVDVGAQVSGRLEVLHVQIGDEVKKGDLIGEIDPRIYEAQVQASEARLKTLRAQLAEQEAQMRFSSLVYERNKKLMASDAVSRESLEESQREYDVAKAKAQSLRAQIEEANSSLNESKTNLGFTRIYAPMSGTVVVETTKQGMTVNANQTAPVIVQLADLDVMTVRAQIAEADVMRVKEGMEVTFTTLGDMEHKWRGTVRQILPSPELVNDVVLYNALVDVDNKERLLMSGMSTQMFFHVGGAEDTLIIPTLALGRVVEEGSCTQGVTYVVRVGQDVENLQEKEVCIGVVSRSEAQVLSGLASGDSVAMIAPQEKALSRPSGGSRAKVGRL